jgi:tRNA (guanine10-N2)-methyltransferase
MMFDVLDFAHLMLVDEGRLCMWMPTANEDIELMVPKHPGLRLISTSVQHFNKCLYSRRCGRVIMTDND